MNLTIFSLDSLHASLFHHSYPVSRMSQGSSSNGSSAQMAAEPAPSLESQVAEIRSDLAKLLEIHARSTGISDLALFSLSSNIGYAPHLNIIKLYTFSDTCLIQELIFLSPLDAADKVALAPMRYSMVGMDYSAPLLPEGLVLPPDLKARDKQPFDIQYQMDQAFKFLDYHVDRLARDLGPVPFLQVVELLTTLWRILANQGFYIYQARLDNIVHFVSPRSRILLRFSALQPLTSWTRRS